MMNIQNTIFGLIRIVTILMFTLILPGIATAQRMVPLYTWYSPSREDYFTTSDPYWAGMPGDQKSPDYAFVRIEGQVFNPRLPEPDTMPLYSWWNAARGDNFLTSDPFWRGQPGQRRDGYTFSRIEGYIYRTPLAGTVPLHTFWNRNRQDNYATADALYGSSRRPDGYVGPGVAGYILPPEQRAPHTLEDFGFGTLTVNNSPAIGRRPMLVLLVEFSDARFREGRDRAYYNRLIFGPGYPNIVDYYSENSSNLFTWQSAGTLGPIRAVDNRATPDDESTYAVAMRDHDAPEGKRMAARAIEMAATQYGFDFSRYDSNGDGTVATDELAIVMIHAGPGDNIVGSNRGSDPCCIRPAGSTVTVQTAVAIAGDGASFATLAHEICHSLGAKDLYGSGSHSEGLTLMSTTAYNGREIRSTFHLDPWHKMRFGWIEPRIVPLNSVGDCFEIIATQVTGGHFATRSMHKPILLYDVTRGVREYFLLEFRNGLAGGGGYDRSINDWRGNSSGVAVWHAKVDDSNTPLEIPGIKITPGDNGRLDTIPAGNDEDHDLNGDGIKDLLTPGPDRDLQSVPALDDKYWSDQAVFMRGAPNGRRGDAALLRETDRDLVLDWLRNSTEPSVHALRVRAAGYTPDATRVSVEWSAREQLIPRIDYSPEGGRAGSQIRLRGMFGVAQGTRRVSLIADDIFRYELRVTSWTPWEIVAWLPPAIHPGRYDLLIYTNTPWGSHSNRRPFDVRQ
jgi:M6 family metalloprotease-like protein